MDTDTDRSLDTTLDQLKSASRRDPAPNAEKRIEWIEKSIDLLQTNRHELNEAMNADFGCRSRDQSDMTDIAGSIAALRFAQKGLKKWMLPQKRSAQFPLGLFGARAQVRFQPKGVVGIISPWNFPVSLTFNPLAGVFAAGNRAMIKPSEHTPLTSALLEELFAKYYAPDEVRVVTGGPEVGAAFSRLPFDHLVFTGGTSIAHHVMRSAAENLVPLTLELGGKSPVIVESLADIEKAAVRILTGKTLNAGQICLAPDYLFLPEDKVEPFLAAAQAAVAAMYPEGLMASDDYVSIINKGHYQRLLNTLEEARSGGAKVIEINPAGDDFSEQPHQKLAPHIVIDPPEDSSLMTEEIFGPILPLKTYQSLDEVIDYINERPRPLALYYFGDESASRERVLEQTVSGGVTINDVFFHVAQEDLPFGGIGASGMGAYHGRDGFLEFSHKRAVYRQTKSDLMAAIRPPYGESFRKLIEKRING
jgi:coniferyl-aldehyde dehydrogenase